MNNLTIDDIKAMAQKAHRDKTCRDGLFATMLSGEGKEASNAAWALTHLPDSDNKYIDEHRDALVLRAISTPEVPVRRLSLNLLERLEWGIDDIRTDLLDFCLAHMMDPNETEGVRSLCIKLAYAQCRHYDELLGELQRSLQLLDVAHLKPSLLYMRKKILGK